MLNDLSSEQEGMCNKSFLRAQYWLTYFISPNCYYPITFCRAASSSQALLIVGGSLLRNHHGKANAGGWTCFFASIATWLRNISNCCFSVSLLPTHVSASFTINNAQAQNWSDCRPYFSFKPFVAILPLQRHDLADWGPAWIQVSTLESWSF